MPSKSSCPTKSPYNCTGRGRAPPVERSPPERWTFDPRRGSVDGFHEKGPIFWLRWGLIGLTRWFPLLITKHQGLNGV